MSDSVDRVFSHALNTVNKIRTGSEKPPAATQLKLYGLYKQSMEGDVEGIMDRPSGRDEASARARDKWDSWQSCAGFSRTEAKRRYITTLIQAMHTYASPSPDARELVSELEFVWDQVKSNVPSSSSSSPLQTVGMPAGTQLLTRDKPPPSFPQLDTSVGATKDGKGKALRVMSPMSQSQEEEAEAEEAVEAADAADAEVFVDAPDSQVAEPPPPPPPPPHSSAASQPDSQDRPPGPDGVSLGRKKPPSGSSSSRDPRWRARVESALVQLTAEVAALREQLESRRLFALSRRGRLWSWAASAIWLIVKHVALDVFLLLAVLLWLRRRRDRRLEMAVRVLFGDAIAEASRIGGSVQHAVGRGKKTTA